MYRINNTTIDTDTLTANVNIVFDDGTELEVNVPVLYPKSEDDVLLAIAQREANEVKRHNAAPVLDEVKKSLDARIGADLTVMDAKSGAVQMATMKTAVGA